MCILEFTTSFKLGDWKIKLTFLLQLYFSLDVEAKLGLVYDKNSKVIQNFKSVYNVYTSVTLKESICETLGNS